MTKKKENEPEEISTEEEMDECFFEDYDPHAKPKGTLVSFFDFSDDAENFS